MQHNQGQPYRGYAPGAYDATRIRQGGFSLLTALFLLVVVSGITAYLVNLATAQHLSSALTVQKPSSRQPNAGCSTITSATATGR